MDQLSQVEIFLEVVKQESFAAAARSLGMSGPAVSKQVQSLEKKLGVKLLHRTTRRVSLTEEGSLYSQKARVAIEDLNEAKQEILDLQSSPVGRLKINAPMSFGRQYLVEPIARFAKLYPDIEMEVDFDDRWVDMVGEGYDVVIRIGVLNDSSLVARKLAPCPISLFASPAFLEEYGEPKSIRGISDYPAIIYTKQSQSHEWRFADADGNIATVKLKRHFAANNAELEVEACLQGIGLAILPIFAAAPYLETGQLIPVLPDHQTTPERGIYALYPQNRMQSTRVTLFVDWLKECSRDYPWQP